MTSIFSSSGDVSLSDISLRSDLQVFKVRVFEFAIFFILTDLCAFRFTAV